VKQEDTGNYVFRISQLAVLGPLVDWYFFPKYGFHAEAAPGLATYVARSGEPSIEGPLAQAHTAIGFGFILGVGYDFWLGEPVEPRPARALQLRRHDRQRRSRREFHAQLLRTRAVDHANVSLGTSAREGRRDFTNESMVPHIAFARSHRR